jgi:hypothetical protein
VPDKSFRFAKDKVVCVGLTLLGKIGTDLIAIHREPQ